MQFLRRPRTIGAIAPSSELLAKRMMLPIDFSSAACIVELGAGMGVFTEHLLRSREPQTTLLIFEINAGFHAALNKKFQGLENIFILHQSADQLERVLKDMQIDHVDYIVSGLPFASLPRTTTAAILDAARSVLGHTGKLILFQYSTLNAELFATYFSRVARERVIFNLPPAFVFVCQV
ncbi:MAG: class I SAM-dependent methyltransferase [Luteimonas sp.]